MKVYVLRYIDVMPDSETKTGILGVYKTLASAQKQMKEYSKLDVKEAKDRGGLAEITRGNRNTSIEYAADDYVAYDISEREVK